MYSCAPLSIIYLSAVYRSPKIGRKKKSPVLVLPHTFDSCYLLLYIIYSVYSFLYFPWFHETAIILRTYFLQTRGYKLYLLEWQSRSGGTSKANPWLYVSNTSLFSEFFSGFCLFCFRPVVRIVQGKRFSKVMRRCWVDYRRLQWDDAGVKDLVWCAQNMKD